MTTTTTGATCEHRIGTNGRFAVRLRVGEIRIRAVDGETARVTDPAGGDLAERFEIAARPGELELQPRVGLASSFVIAIGSRRWGRGGDLEVELPRGTAVSVETTSGEIRVDGMHGPGRYQTASGDVTLDGVGGILEINAVNGSVGIAADEEIGLQLHTVSGDAKVQAPRIRRLGLTTVSGDARVDGDLVGSGPFAIETLSGDAVVVAHRGMRVDARTITGELLSDLDHRAQEGGGRRGLTIGDGQALLTFKSVSGDLRIAAPRTVAQPVTPSVSPTPAPAPGAPDAPDAPAALDAPDATDGSRRADARMDILRALERGDVSVETATARLAALDDEEDER